MSLRCFIEAANAKETKPGKKSVPRFVISEVNADGTSLEILLKKAGKDPLQFDIKQLTLWGAGPADPMSLRATLTNARPVGEIHREGQFGPWQRNEPALTPVAGRYTFQHADLSVFKGIAGILPSESAYTGVLDAIRVKGTTDTPDFRLDISGNPIHLAAQFQAEVDRTDGDTRLEPVYAKFGKSSVTARGAIGFHTTLLIPPGDQDVVEKLQLDGRFAVDEARFSKLNLQQKVNELSHRSRGQTENSQAGLIASDFRGRFIAKNGCCGWRTWFSAFQERKSS